MLFIGLPKSRLRRGCPKEHGAIREKTMNRIRALLVLILCALAQQLFLSVSSSAQGIPQNIPRKELLILENPEGTIKNAGWFNIWAINAGSQSNGLQQAALDTLWYIDPESGLDGVWDNSLAADKPQYNADFTEMTAKLRKGIFCGDGDDPDQESGDAVQRGHGEQCRLGRGAGSLHSGVQAQEAQFALPCQFH